MKEPLARNHQLKGISCAKCHGPSIAHANDEHVGATRPDTTFPREKVDKACKVCHEEHDVPATQVIARYLERKLPSRPAAICTDCHGSHRIDSMVSPSGTAACQQLFPGDARRSALIFTLRDSACSARRFK